MRIQGTNRYVVVVGNEIKADTNSLDHATGVAGSFRNWHQSAEIYERNETGYKALPDSIRSADDSQTYLSREEVIGE